jgi:predicted HAD superfamily hydrolase
MALGTATTCDLCDLFPEFSMQRQLVHEARCAISSRAPSNVYPLLGDCTCDRQKQHFPNYVHHHDCVELHGQLKLLVLNSKHTDLHREQRLRGERVVLNGGMEYEQTY